MDVSPRLLARYIQYIRAASGIRGWTEKSIGKGTERYWTHQIFDVTNPKKVGGSTTGTQPTQRLGGGWGLRPAVQIRGCLENAERYVAADLT